MFVIPTDMHCPVTFVCRSLDTLLPTCTEVIAMFARAWRISGVLADSHGRPMAAAMACEQRCAGSADCAAAYRRAIEESVRWGEPSVLLCPMGHVIWAAPVMDNSEVIGGLIAVCDEQGDGAPTLSATEIRQAMDDLLRRATEANLTNAAYLTLQRMAAQRESERAVAIHEMKRHNYQSLREVFLAEEPPLISAIKRGDRAAARGVINRVLTNIYFLAQDRPRVLKSFLLELVVMMSRSAVEAGGDPAELLGANYSSFAELAALDGEEEICAWLVWMLERIMDAITATRQYPASVLLGEALRYMRDHLHDNLSRDDVAEVACLSPSHFSRAIKQHFGSTFTELLTRMRVEKARDLLVITDKSLLQICLDCGFSDQSYFSKVFQKHTGHPPGEYRRLQRSSG